MTGRSVIQLRRGTEILEIEGRSVVLGRSHACDVDVEDNGVSRRHCELFLDNRGLAVRDLGSRHGTWVDGIRLESETRVKTGQVISLGERGPKFQIAGALMNGYPWSGGPSLSDFSAARAMADSPEVETSTRFVEGLVIGIMSGVIAGLAMLAFTDMTETLTALRDALGIVR